MSLHERIATELDRREAIARAATAGPWHWDRTPNPDWGEQEPSLVSDSAVETYEFSSGSKGEYPKPVVSAWGHDAWGINVEDADAAFIAESNPADALRRYAAARRVLQRHHPVDEIDLLEGGPWCAGCSIVDDASGNVAVVPVQVCRELPDLASSLSLEVDD